MAGEKKTVKKIVKRKKGAPLPEVIRQEKSKTKGPSKKKVYMEALIQKKPKDFRVGADIMHKMDVTRFVRWPKYIRLQRQKAILYQRIKIPPTVNQFNSCTLDRQAATQLFKLMDKYRPESKREKVLRLKKIAQQKAEGKEVAPAKRPLTVLHGVNKVTTLIEQKKAQLVCIAGDVDPIEIVIHLPAICRKMGIPYCVLKGGRARLGRLVHRKSVAVVALTGVNPEDRTTFSKLTETIKTNFNDRFDEIRRQWGGGVLSKRSRSKVLRLEKAKEKERMEKEAL